MKENLLNYVINSILTDIKKDFSNTFINFNKIAQERDGTLAGILVIMAKRESQLIIKIEELAKKIEFLEKRLNYHIIS